MVELFQHGTLMGVTQHWDLNQPPCKPCLGAYALLDWSERKEFVHNYEFETDKTVPLSQRNLRALL